MAEFQILNPLIGGVLIGLAASGMLWANGRVMGISGIIGGLLRPAEGEKNWRILFLIGLIVGSFLIPFFGFTVMEISYPRDVSAAVIGGLLVGLGTALGNGCTSGHGVCGISRLSKRSFVATGTFMFFGILTVAIYNLFFGGAA